MAEEESRSSSCIESNPKEEEDEERWLQLGVGVSDATQARGDFVKLDLFLTSPAPAPTPFFLQQGIQEISWGCRNRPYNFWHPFPSSPSSSSSVPPSSMGIYCSDMRVIDVPKRVHSGIWFMIQASPNQANEPFLPQISKRYIRIKDGKMTVGFVIKYLVKKLRLSNESEVEITCRGQPLPLFLTLQNVRDNIWNMKNTMMSKSLLMEYSTKDHVMVLNYGRTSC